MPKGRAASIPRTTTCWRPRPASRASSPSPRATCRRSTGSGSRARGERRRLPHARIVERLDVRVPHAACCCCAAIPKPCSRDLPRRRATQIHYGRRNGVPWGISESAFNAVDPHGDYQYKAFGVPGLGLKRGLAEDLVIAPYATALARLVEPAAAAANFRRLAREGGAGRYGFREALDYTPRKTYDAARATPAGPRRSGVVVRTYFAHHQGMTLVGARQRAARRRDGASASTPILACRRPSCCCRSACRAWPRSAPPRPAEESRAARRRADSRRGASASPHTSTARPVPVERLVRHGRHQRRGRRQHVARPRGDARGGRTRPRIRAPVHLPPRRAQRARHWSATYQPNCREPDGTW